jgi:hypothetical protein
MKNFARLAFKKLSLAKKYMYSYKFLLKKIFKSLFTIHHKNHDDYLKLNSHLDFFHKLSISGEHPSLFKFQ